MLLSSYRHLLRYSALAAWGFTALPVLYRLSVDGAPSTGRFLLWLSSFAVFGLAFWLNTSSRHTQDARRSLSLLSVQTVSGLISVWDGLYGFSALFTVLIAMQLLPTFSLRDAQKFVPPLPEALLDKADFERSNTVPRVSLRGSLLWVLAQTTLLCIVHGVRWGWIGVAPMGVSYFGFQMFVLFTAHLAVQESRARGNLEAALSELRATQTLLEDTSRLSERLRISRDLHDAIGHHLTALSLNLEIASVSETRRLEHVHKAQALSKLLLSEVRDTVSQMRGGAGLDLKKALSALVREVPALHIRLELPEKLRLEDPLKAQIVLRCVQEIITNTLRHAQASHLWLDITCQDGQLEVSSRDDGQGMASGALEGNGLRGMRERLLEVGGRLEVSSKPLEGTALHLSFPLQPAKSGDPKSGDPKSGDLVQG